MTARRFRDYREVTRHTAELAGVRITHYTRAGIADAALSPAVRLLADHAAIERGMRVLVCPSGNGALAAWAAEQAGAAQTLAADTNDIAASLTRQTFEACGHAAARVLPHLPGAKDGPFDALLMPIPKGRHLSRLTLLAGSLAVRPEGSIYVAGANKEGIKSVLKDGEALLGKGALLAYRKGSRVMRFSRPALDPGDLPTPFDAPGLLPGTYTTFAIVHEGVEYSIHSRPGVFSRDRLDAGTALLLSVLRVGANDRVLDLGCGYGIIGMVAARASSAERVTMIDVDALAVECARASAEANGLGAIRVLQGDGMAPVEGQRFDLIVSNPPFHAGHEVSLDMAHAFVRESQRALRHAGRLVIVANRFLAYDKVCQAQFGNVHILAETPHYHVMASKNHDPRRNRRR